MSLARPAAGGESCFAGFYFISKERNKAMYNKVDTNLNFMEREKNVEQFWRDNDIFKKSMEQRV